MAAHQLFASETQNAVPIPGPAPETEIVTSVLVKLRVAKACVDGPELELAVLLSISQAPLQIFHRCPFAVPRPD